MFKLTALYGGLLAALYILLSAGVIRARRRLQVSLGHGEQRELERRIRAYGNFAEYVPLALLLLAAAESLAPPPALLHALGGCLLAGRALHAWGLSYGRETGQARVVGMVLTFTALGGVALTGAASAIYRWIA